MRFNNPQISAEEEIEDKSSPWRMENFCLKGIMFLRIVQNVGIDIVFAKSKL